MIKLECVKLKNEVQKAFKRFEEWLIDREFPISLLYDFMFMGENNGILQFKHWMTRNYIFVGLNDFSISSYYKPKESIKAFNRFIGWLAARNIDTTLVKNFNYMATWEISNEYIFQNKNTKKFISINIEPKCFNE